MRYEVAVGGPHGPAEGAFTSYKGRMRRLLPLTAATFAVLTASAPAKTMLNIVPHGNRAPGVPWASTPGILPADTQAKMYDRITPLFRNVGDDVLKPSADGSGYYKSAELLDINDPSFVSSQDVAGTSPSAGAVKATIKRDPYGVPHVYSDTDAGAIFGVGYTAATDQALLLSVARDNGVAGLIDMPGVPAINLILGLYEYKPTEKVRKQAERLQTRNILKQGTRGKQLLNDIDTYIAGINTRLKEASPDTKPVSRIDIYALNAVKAQFLGQGGGKETQNALFLDGLRSALGKKAGNGVFADLQARNDPEAAVTTANSFAAQTKVSTAKPKGMVRLKNGSLQDQSIKLPGAYRRVAAPPAGLASNILIMSGSRSGTGAPLFVGGPQIGYNYPGLTYELQIRSPSINTRGVSSGPFPGYMLIGSGPDYAWTLTSAGADIIDTYAETLCGGSRHKYRYKGKCRKMKRVSAGTITKGEDTVSAVFYRTVHGPVTGYARNRATGRLVALSRKRSSYGKETVDQLFNQDLTFGRVKSAADFAKAAKKTPQTFNSFYASATESSFYTAGAFPKRRKGVNPTLPVSGTGRYEWRGLLPASKHPQVVNPASGAIINWNNKPAANFPAGDDRFGSEGGLQRDLLLNSEIDRYPKASLANVLAAANAGATEDVRGNQFWPTLKAMLAKAPAPDALSQQMYDVLDKWNAAGASRVDADLDGTIDDPGAPIIDAAWDGLADAAMCDRLGAAMCEQLATTLRGRYDTPPGGQYGGWHQYMWKDFRSILGEPVKGAYSTKYCGKGDAAACATKLWAALSAAGAKLAAEQGPDPSKWRENTTYINFTPISLFKMQYTNKPSGIHQVMTFGP